MCLRLSTSIKNVSTPVKGVAFFSNLTHYHGDRDSNPIEIKNRFKKYTVAQKTMFRPKEKGAQPARQINPHLFLLLLIEINERVYIFNYYMCVSLLLLGC